MMGGVDMQFMKDMNANHEAGIAIAKKYLKASPAERRAQVTTMAKSIVAEHTAEMAKMTEMMKAG